MILVIDRVMPPPPHSVYILMLGTYERVTLPGKRDFADVIKLRTWRWGAIPGLSRGAHCNHKGDWRVGDGIGTMEAEVRVMWP